MPEAAQLIPRDLMPSIGIVQTRYDAAEHRRLATCDVERWRFIPDRDQA